LYSSVPENQYATALRIKVWQARRESNPQPAVLETAALPIELLAFRACRRAVDHHNRKLYLVTQTLSKATRITSTYSITFATTPAPTVRPPSRIAKRSPSSIAIGAIRSTTICTLSPGITISVPSGNSQAPVTSVVRK
jgi:hypothetical protein